MSDSTHFLGHHHYLCTELLDHGGVARRGRGSDSYKMDASAAGKVVTMPALGRAFRPGDLYDCRSDQLVFSLKLWDEDTLKETEERRCDFNGFEVFCSDSFQKKAEVFDMSGSLKLSFLGGLLEVGGSAKYLNEKRESFRQQRVWLRYHCTTRVESLTMAHLDEGRVQHPNVFSVGEATHVVTSVTYGANAIFEFSSSSKDSSTDFEASGGGKLGVGGKKDAKGFLQSVVKSIPGTEIGGEVKCEWTEKEKEEIKGFGCKFFGDFSLDKNPSTYEEAVEAYKTLPMRLGEKGERAVPVQVQLRPLCRFDDKASKLLRDIRAQLISQTEKFFEEMHGYDMTCNDLLEFDAVKCFGTIREQLEDFRELINNYKCIIQKDFRELLPRVRGGEDSDTSIEDLLKKVSSSPFSRESLRSWLQTREADIKVLSVLTQALSDIRFATRPGDLESVIMSPHTKQCLCLVFSVPRRASQLEAMRECYFGTNIATGSGQSVAAAQDVAGSSKLSMKKLVCAFGDFYKANTVNNKGVSFIVAQEFSDCSSLNARIEYYKDDERKSINYELPSAPESVKVVVEDATHNSLTIEWQPPQCGASAVCSYVVCCNDNAATQEVSHEHHRATITGLAPNTEYNLQVCTATLEVGRGPCREAEGAVKTRPASPPQGVGIYKASPTEVVLAWRAPECLAADCGVEHYVIKHEEAGSGRWEETVCTSLNGLTHRVEVRPRGVHRFKVGAFCGPAGGYTCDSKSVTLDFDHHVDASDDLKQYICANSSVVEGSPHILVPRMTVITDDPQHRRVVVGDSQASAAVAEKVVLLVGDSDSGVKGIIDAIVNYIFGVKWEDPFRFRVTGDPEAEINRITSYTVHHQEGSLLPYTITLIITPPFGTFRHKNREILKNVDSFFERANITHIDAVGLVVGALGTTLSMWQLFVLEEAVSLLGKDIAGNIFILFPFSDGSEPQHLGSMGWKLSPRKHIKVNTAALYARWSGGWRGAGGGGGDTDEDCLTGASLLWDMGVRNLRLLLEQFTFVERKSLTLTREVIRERIVWKAAMDKKISSIEMWWKSCPKLKEIALIPIPLSLSCDYMKLQVGPSLCGKPTVEKVELITACFRKSWKLEEKDSESNLVYFFKEWLDG